MDQAKGASTPTLCSQSRQTDAYGKPATGDACNSALLPCDSQQLVFTGMLPPTTVGTT